MKAGSAVRYSNIISNCSAQLLLGDSRIKQNNDGAYVYEHLYYILTIKSGTDRK